MKKHETFMAEAIRMARENITTGHGGPFGAVVVKDGQIIARAANRVIIDSDPTAHAEIVAIRETCAILGSFQLSDCEIYTSCEPCPMCLGAIYWARPKAVYYAGTRDDAAQVGFDDAHIYQQIALPPDARAIPAYIILREEAVKVFELWKESENKIPY